MKYIYFHPFFEERKWAHRFSFQLSCAFKKIGIDIERFDYYGTGEAEGNFEDVSFDSLQNSIQQNLTDDSYCLIGTRLGATLAFICMNQMSIKVEKLIMINPIIQGNDYINYIYRQQNIKNLLTGNFKEETDQKEYVNIEGFKTNILLINQINLFSIHNSYNVHKKSIPIHYFYISKNGKLPSDAMKDIDILKARYTNMNITLLSLPLFWQRIAASDYSELINKILVC